MIRNVAAAIGSVKLHALLPQYGLGSQQMLATPIPPQGDHMRMLAKQQHIPHRLSLTRRNNPLLQSKRVRKPDQPKIDHET
jgi:hypothetical protein